MAKYLDKTEDEWADLVEKWNNDLTITCSLQEYLELDDIEYLKFAHGMNEKNLTDEEVLKKSSEIAKTVFTELVLKPKLKKVSELIILKSEDSRL